MFIKKNEWFPQSPDLNLMGYSGLDSLPKEFRQENGKVFRTRTEGQDREEKWDEISIAKIDHIFLKKETSIG